MQTKNTSNKLQKTVRLLLISGAMLAMNQQLTGCAAKQVIVVMPDYTAGFLLCVAEEYDRRHYGDCTSKAIDDWSVIID